MSSDLLTIARERRSDYAELSSRIRSAGLLERRTAYYIATFTLSWAFVAAPFLVLNPWQAVAFIAIQQAVFGCYMGCSFAPNHRGMPPRSATDEKDYLRGQVLTSRNVRGGRFVDLLLGGLNYQIEHHLFPSTPRATLRRAQAPIAQFCADRGIRYTETGLLTSYRLALGHLDAVTAGQRVIQ